MCNKLGDFSGIFSIVVIVYGKNLFGKKYISILETLKYGPELLYFFSDSRAKVCLKNWARQEFLFLLSYHLQLIMKGPAATEHNKILHLVSKFLIYM
jgi:hypothetical protein